MFAFLDASYLREERGFRNLYDAVRVRPDDEAVDFTLSPLMSCHSLSSVIFSWSIAGLYSALLLLQITALGLLMIAELVPASPVCWVDRINGEFSSPFTTKKIAFA